MFATNKKTTINGNEYYLQRKDRFRGNTTADTEWRVVDGAGRVVDSSVKGSAQYALFKNGKVAGFLTKAELKDFAGFETQKITWSKSEFQPQEQKQA